MRFLAVFVALVCVAYGQTAAKKAVPSPVAKSSATSTAKSTAKTSTPTAKAAPKAAAKSNTKGKRPVAARRPVQQQPSVDRYKEIQQALADRGYSTGTVDGTWGPESVDALKRFQKDQNLDSDGKIGALSLMALGLGPKRGAAAAENLAAPGSKPGASAQPEPVDPPPVAQPETPELPPGVQPVK